ncbi:NUDIX hydrolase [Mameliella sp. CS4]|uniref:NUDIX domain-containing protein n=1 Tax=Mameliella sp. CS4 TaxID=2862329 RepID=UPI001C5E077D|nr:NUDIX hydrolase [Mameliella sp. CS4]MBW4980959.1 NUDIX hydrolase [Mameliella sp. CS4]
MPAPRIACRAVILQDNRLLLVNAWPGNTSDLWCAPGGGVEPHSSLPENLAREVLEETGLRVEVGAPCLVNEFDDPARGFHQVEVFFRARITSGTLSDDWKDPEGVVHMRRFFARDELASLRLKPSSLPDVAWGEGLGYDPLEPILY